MISLSPIVFLISTNCLSLNGSIEMLQSSHVVLFSCRLNLDTQVDTKGFDHLPTQRVPPLVLFKKSIFGRPTLKFFYFLLYFVQSKAGDNALIDEARAFKVSFTVQFVGFDNDCVRCPDWTSDLPTPTTCWNHKTTTAVVVLWQTTKFDFDHTQKSGASSLSSRVYLLK